MKYDDDKIIQLIDQLRSDGAEFCVEFVDSNSDQGALGSFTGVRQSQ